MRLLWIFTLIFTFLLILQNVNANKKGSGNKGMTHDEGQHYHPDAARDGNPALLKKGHRDHSPSSHGGKHKGIKHHKGKLKKHGDGVKHHKHGDGKKHHSPGKDHHKHH